ncbi:YjbQ family protein [Candidatus Pacearchaeota archaeon]|nr:MAG: YjbQ family protein [Candidatus Pacearchaeota archaeon]
MEIFIQSKKREELIDITSMVEEKIKISNGIVNLFVPHATAAITINENADPNLPLDISSFLKEKVKKGIWLHDRIDNNADAHIKSTLIGPSITIPVSNKKLLLGTWQNIFFCEFDGPRKRKIIITEVKNEA